MARRRRNSSPAGSARSFLGRRWFLRLNLAAALLLGGWYFAQPSSRQNEVRRLVSAALSAQKNVSALDVVWDVWQLYYANPARAALASGDKTHVYGGAPVFTGTAGSTRLRVLVNRGYVVGYDDANAGPAWAAYRVRDLPTLPASPPRPDKFSVDRRTAARVSPEAYTGSGYDRGHLAPNYAIATRHGVAAQEETFLMSNITPQLHSLNAGLWKELEQKIATSYPARYEEVWVLTGPIYGTSPRELRSGVKIPEAFFLIVVDEHEGKLRTLSLLVPQSAAPSDDPNRYLTSVDEIEKRTHLDFLAELEDASESLLEQPPSPKVW